MTTPDTPVVLLVEDQPDVAETYKRWLTDRYDVRHAENGNRALDVLADDDVDVVLLDRMMPGMSGEEVLQEIRAWGYSCRVAMVTAVDPDFDILEMGFDDYIQKPPTKAQLVETIETLLKWNAYSTEIREYHSLVAKRAALQTQKSRTELSLSGDFTELERRIGELESSLSAMDTEFLDDAAFLTAIREFDGDDGGASL